MKLAEAVYCGSSSHIWPESRQEIFLLLLLLPHLRVLDLADLCMHDTGSKRNVLYCVATWLQQFCLRSIRPLNSKKNWQTQLACVFWNVDKEHFLQFVFNSVPLSVLKKAGHASVMNCLLNKYKV